MILELSDLDKAIATACVLFRMPMEDFAQHFTFSLWLLNAMLPSTAEKGDAGGENWPSAGSQCSSSLCRTVPALCVGQNLFLKAASFSQPYRVYCEVWGHKRSGESFLEKNA